MNIAPVFRELKKVLPKEFISRLENPIYQILISENKLKCYFDFKQEVKKNINGLQELKYLFTIGLLLAKHKCFYPSVIIFFFCLVKDRNNFDAYYNIGICFKNLNKSRLAIIYFNKQEKIFGKNNNLNYQLAKCHQVNGNIKLSEIYFCELLKNDKFFYEAHREYSIIHKYLKEDKHLKTLHELENQQTINEKDKKFIYFALSKAYEDLKDYEKSFDYLCLGNLIRKQEVFYSSSIIKNQFLSIKNAYHSISARSDLEIKKIIKTPINIIGLPRSGTTLIEQIISSHSKVYSMAESLAFPNCIKEYFPSSDPKLFESELKNVNLKTLKKFRKTYFDIQFKQTNKDYITDKLPFNFIFLGLINKFIPESKIIHIRRNAKDTCLSILKNYFIGKNIGFAYNENDLIDYYYQYEDLMNFWKVNCPGCFLEINYEDLINNFESTTARILSFLNLNYEDTLKDFYKNKSSVFSLSVAQVRNPIYKSSVNNWRNFEPYLSSNFKQLP